MSSSPDSMSAAMARHRISLPEEQVGRLDEYCRLLWDWNTHLNLTRHTDYEKFVSRDMVDSLAFAGFLSQKERVLDVGTGGGVPGVVLAIVRPGAGGGAAASGTEESAARSTVKVAPLLIPSLKAVNVPWCSSMMLLAMVRPMPSPPKRRVLVCSA